MIDIIHQREVSEAAVWLDDFEPDWHHQIDLSELDMTDSYKCIGGQLSGSYMSFLNHLYMREGGHLRSAFNCNYVDHKQKAWKQEIRKRRWADIKSKFKKLLSYVTFHRTGHRG